MTHYVLQEVIRYLQHLQLSVPGFDFKVKKDSQGRPEGICWMFPHTRRELLYYGRTLFLDVQQKQYNLLGRPYHAPTLKDCDMKVYVAAEHVILEKVLNTYEWV